MAKQQFITPSVATTDDRTGYMNVISTTDGGEMQVVTTGGTVNTIGPDKHVVVGDMLVGPGHYKTIPTDLYVDGDLSIEKEDDIVIGDKTVTYQGILTIDGELLATGDIDIQGDLIFEDNPVADDGIKAGSTDETGWVVLEDGPWSGLRYKTITFTTPFSDANYAISLTPVNGPGASGADYLLVNNKTASAFDIYATTLPDLSFIDWVAIKY
jgi:hypothetical protein